LDYFEFLAKNNRVLWRSSGEGYEIFREWLSVFQESVCGKLCTLWDGHADAWDQWAKEVVSPP
jgi:hypothetical protein